MPSFPFEVIEMIGQTMMKVVPITIALALCFTVLAHFWACNPGKPWWQKRELVTDICYWFFVPVFARVLRIGLLVVAAAALWFGFEHLLPYLVLASLFGGALTVLLLQLRQWPLPYPLASQAWLSRLHDKQTGIPYGIALALGALMVYPETEWVKAIDLAHLALR